MFQQRGGSLHCWDSYRLIRDLFTDNTLNLLQGTLVASVDKVKYDFSNLDESESDLVTGTEITLKHSL